MNRYSFIITAILLGGIACGAAYLLDGLFGLFIVMPAVLTTTVILFNTINPTASTKNQTQGPAELEKVYIRSYSKKDSP